MTICVMCIRYVPFAGDRGRRVRCCGNSCCVGCTKVARRISRILQTALGGPLLPGELLRVQLEMFPTATCLLACLCCQIFAAPALFWLPVRGQWFSFYTARVQITKICSTTSTCFPATQLSRERPGPEQPVAVEGVYGHVGMHGYYDFMCGVGLTQGR